LLNGCCQSYIEKKKNKPWGAWVLLLGI
jgi:hypothetical protein